MKNFETFLKKIGVKSDIISKLSTEDEINVDEFAQSFKTNIREVMSNDPDFIQPIKDEIRGTELGKLEHKVKKTFALTSDDVKDKKFDEILQTALDKTKSSGSTTNDDLQNKIIELTKENKRLNDEIIPAKENEAREQIKSYQKESTIRSILGAKQLIVSPDVVFPAIQNHINKAFNIDINDDGGLVVKTKDGLNPLSDDGTKVLSFEDILDNQLRSLNVLKQSNGTPEQKNVERKSTFTPDSTKEAKYNLPGMDAAKQNAEQMKNIRTFGQ